MGFTKCRHSTEWEVGKVFETSCYHMAGVSYVGLLLLINAFFCRKDSLKVEIAQFSASVHTGTYIFDCCWIKGSLMLHEMLENH